MTVPWERVDSEHAINQRLLVRLHNRACSIWHAFGPASRSSSSEQEEPHIRRLLRVVPERSARRCDEEGGGGGHEKRFIIEKSWRPRNATLSIVRRPSPKQPRLVAHGHNLALLFISVAVAAAVAAHDRRHRDRPMEENCKSIHLARRLGSCGLFRGLYVAGRVCCRVRLRVSVADRSGKT